MSKNGFVSEDLEPEDLETGQVDDFKEGDVSSEEPDKLTEFKESYARKFGWKPKEEFGGNPDDWRDVDSFLDETPKIVRKNNENHRKQLMRLQEASERALRIAEAEAKKQALREAWEQGDLDRAVQVATTPSQAPSHDPEVAAWAASNPWFTVDPVATSAAQAIADREARNGRSTAEQLRAVDREMKRRFPDLYADDYDDEPEAPKVVRRAPPTQAATRSIPQRPKEKGYHDIPAKDREQLETFRQRFMNTYKKSEKEANQMVAEMYFNRD